MITIFMKTFAPCYLTVYDGIARLVCGDPDTAVGILNGLVPPPSPGFMLMETGDFLLLESGDKIILE